MGNITKAELEKQNETNLVGFLSNDSVGEDTKLYAAVLLYKRGSRFLTFQEWIKYKDRVLDYLLEEQAKSPVLPFAPNTPADFAGRLHTKANATSENVSYAHVRIQNNHEQCARWIADHDVAISRANSRMMLDREHVLGQVEDLSKTTDQQLSAVRSELSSVRTTFNSYKRTTNWALGIGSVVVLITNYLIHHFLR